MPSGLQHYRASVVVCVVVAVVFCYECWCFCCCCCLYMLLSFVVDCCFLVRSWSCDLLLCFCSGTKEHVVMSFFCSAVVAVHEVPCHRQGPATLLSLLLPYILASICFCCVLLLRYCRSTRFERRRNYYCLPPTPTRTPTLVANVFVLVSLCLTSVSPAHGGH